MKLEIEKCKNKDYIVTCEDKYIGSFTYNHLYKRWEFKDWQDRD